MDLDSGQHHRGVGVLQAGQDTLGHLLGLFGGTGLVRGQGVQDENLAPLGALADHQEQLVLGGAVQDQVVDRGAGGDVRQGSHRVGNHHGVRVRQHLLELVQEA